MEKIMIYLWIMNPFYYGYILTIYGIGKHPFISQLMMEGLHLKSLCLVG